MTDVVAEMSRADVWVLGTPVYCYGPSGASSRHSLIVGFPSFRRSTRRPRLQDSSRFICRRPGAESTRALLRTVCRGFGITYLGDLVAPGLLHREDLDAHPGLRQEAVRLAARGSGAGSPIGERVGDSSRNHHAAEIDRRDPSESD